jgi:tRNA-binding EMAP/Myf-like protein
MKSSLGGNLAFISLAKFLEDELLACSVEVGQWHGVRDIVCSAREARVETTKEVEDQLGW